VIGGGPLGLMILHVAALAGCTTIAIVKHDGQMEAARQLGATHVVADQQYPQSHQRDARSHAQKSRGRYLPSRPWVFPMPGKRPLSWCARGGCVNFFGGCAVGTHITLDTESHPLQRHHAPRHVPPYAGHLPKGSRSDLPEAGSSAQAFITGHAHLYELNRVFEKLMNRSSEIKTAIVP